MYGAPPPAKSSGGGWVKILLIVVGVFVLLGVIVMGFVGYGIYRVREAVKSVKVDDKGNATITGLGGAISAGKDVKVSEADLGVPIYPGAVQGQGGMKMNLPGMTMNTVIFTTNDPKSAVMDFYKGKLGDNESDMDNGENSVMTSATSDKKNVTMITVGPGSGDKAGKTQITIMHRTTTKPD
jgi:hypothetical protein